jgi:hypothetical protein
VLEVILPMNVPDLMILNVVVGVILLRLLPLLMDLAHLLLMLSGIVYFLIVQPGFPPELGNPLTNARSLYLGL